MRLSDLKVNSGKHIVVSNLLVSDRGNYLRLEFSDSSKIVINIFNNDKNFPLFNKLDKEVLLLVSTEMEYKGQNSAGYDEFKIHTIETKERPSLTDVVPIEKLKDELRNIIMSVEDENLHDLLFGLCKNKGLLDRFFKAPCTEKSAYSFRGGILAHTVRICRIIDSVVNTTNEWNLNKGGFNERLNRDFLISLAIFHDLGRAVSYKFAGNDRIEKTLEGELLSNTELSVQLMNDIIDKEEIGFSLEQKILLEHAISSSGSNNQCIPRTKESIIFGQIEKIDTVLGNFEYMSRVSVCSDFQRLLDKNYCLIDFDEV